jgi:hypothetical protein
MIPDFGTEFWSLDEGEDRETRSDCKHRYQNNFFIIFSVCIQYFSDETDCFPHEMVDFLTNNSGWQACFSKFSWTLLSNISYKAKHEMESFRLSCKPYLG